jgi:microcystin-dependent protein
MADPFIGEIKMVGFNFPPRGWALCNGQLLTIAQNTALFALLGTTYGGNGLTTFGLPNLQDRTPVHPGMGHTLGEMGGAQTHTLTAAQIGHGHVLKASNNQASTTSPAGNVLAAKRRGGTNIYRAGADVALDASTVSASAGAGGPHNNLQPYLGIYFAIALEGVFPSRN